MRIRDFFLRNLLLKIFSLLFAVALWVVVIGQKQAQIQLDIPLEVVNIPQGVVLVSDIPSSISVQVQGPGTLIRTLTGLGIRKSIDLEGMGIGRTTISIPPDDLPVPHGIEVIRVTPSTLDLKLETSLKTTLPVNPQISGDPPRGYRIDQIIADPPEVVLKGGEGELSGLSEVKTHPVNVSQATTDVEERVGLELEGLHLARVSPATVWVRLKISPILAERALEGVPVRVSSSEMETIIQPDKIKVVLRGPVEIIEEIKTMDIKVTAKLDELEPGDHRIPPDIAVPDGIEVVDVEPSILNVRLERPMDEE